MKRLSRLAAAAAAVAVTAQLTACGSSSGDPAAATAATSETTSATMASEDAEVVAQVEMEAEILENPTLQWLSFWDINPETGETVPVFLELFQTKYGGTVKWIPTTENSKYNDLATLVMSGDSPDIFPAADLDTFPGKVVAGMFEPLDDYVDFDSELFPGGAKKINDMHTIGGKHYMGCVSATIGDIYIYNKKTIQENALDDPAELVKENKWTWDAFKQMCINFADEDEEKYAIDGWWHEYALIKTTGVPVIGMENGVIKNNIMDPNIARAEELFLEMHNVPGVNFPRAQYNWTAHPERVGEGKTLFYPVGSWQLYEPNITTDFGDAGDIMFVPTPRDEQADAWYLNAGGGLDAYAMCKGAPNPKAVAAFINCKLIAATDETVKEVNDKQNREIYGWTDEMIEMYDFCNDLIDEHPVVDFYCGISPDVYEMVHNPVKDASYNGTDWYTTREGVNLAVQTYIDEMNEKIAEMNK